MLSFFPRGVSDEILNLIESVSEVFSSYSYNVLGKTKVLIQENPCTALANEGDMNIYFFTNFKRVSICLLNRLTRFGILRLHMLPELFEYAWGNFSCSQSTKIKFLKPKSFKVGL